MAEERRLVVDDSPADISRIEGRPVRASLVGETRSTQLHLTFAEADELRHELAAFLATSGEPLANACPICGARPGYPCRITPATGAEHSARWNERKGRP